MAQRHKIPEHVLEEAAANGWTVEETRGGHVRWVHKGTGAQAFSAKTSSDPRGWKNQISTLRRKLRQATGSPVWKEA